VSLVQISRDLSQRVDELRFGSPVTHVYNPLRYAAAVHECYLQTWGTGKKDVLLLGMNPGPFGMAQTGVPFGDVAMVKTFLGLQGEVARPDLEHPKRPIEGLACARSEVSGSRLWGWARDRFGSAERFFDRFFVVNYCPLSFMEASARNVTPDKLRVDEQAPLFSACDGALRATVDLLRPRLVVGVGAFAAERASQALADLNVSIGQILHPSPASPAANRGWAAAAEKQLQALGVSFE
jgi:single-strand selective monofunctional uracil DNA glycosylase